MEDYLWNYWSKKIDEIKNYSLDDWQCEDIRSHYVDALIEDCVLKKISQSEFQKLSSDLRFALHVAISNYQKEKWENSLWNKLKISFEVVLNKVGVR